MAVCRSCGADLPAAARYCPRCGVRVATLADDERKVVTVLFADIAASTALGEDCDPEEARAVIRPQLAVMRDELSRHGGTIEKYIGDAVMAVFGAPVAHEDDPERAVRAGLAICEALGTNARVAVNTGEAVVALGAEPEAGEGFVSGDVVNTAFRIEEATPDGAVCVGEATYRATAGTIEYDERRLVEAKGKPEPIAVWRAVRAATEPRGDHGPPLAPLVGRREELALVLETIARARRDKTVQLVTLVGPPGIGKSRLVWELERALEGEPQLVTWRRGRCLPYGDGVTYWALGEMVKAQAGVLENDDTPTAERKLVRAVHQLVGNPAEAAWVEMHLRPLLALGSSATVESREDAFAAWRRFVEALAERGPLTLAFEDLHWADEGLLDFIEHTADWSRDAAILILCTARPELLERRRAWGARGNALTIALPPLNAAETSTLVSLLLRQYVPDELRDIVLARAGGNPLYAEEFVRMLVDRGLLVDDGGWRLTTDHLPVPESVQGIISSRLDALGANEKVFVQAAAVVGRTFWPGAVAAVAGADRSEVDDALRVLDRREIVRRHRSSALGTEPEYVFRHALVRDVAYSQIPRANRGTKHLAAARWIEELGRPEDHAELVAHHYVAAIEYSSDASAAAFVERARDALRLAGERALALNAFEAAAEFFGVAVAGGPEDAGLLFLHAKALFHAGERASAELIAARDALRRAGDEGRAAECEAMLLWVAWYAGLGAEANDHLESALQLAGPLEPSRSRVEVLTSLARFLVVADRPQEAIPIAREALAMSEELGTDDVTIIGRIYLGTARCSVGDGDGLEDLERAIELARATRSPELVRALVNLAGVHVGRGDLVRAFELHEQAREAADQVGNARAARWLRAERVGECYWRGRWGEALELVDSFLAEGPHYLASFCLVVRAKIQLARGNVDAAANDAAVALQLARDARDAQILHPALALAAEVAAAAGESAQAAAYLDELLESYTGSELVTAGPSWASLARAAVALGRARDVLAAATRARAPSAWLEAATFVLEGRVQEAAELYERVGSGPDAEATRDGLRAPAR